MNELEGWSWLRCISLFSLGIEFLVYHIMTKMDGFCSDTSY